jgi:holo-[acyl-carrier protein] synthase
MISGIGIDITEIARIKQTQIRHPKFAERVLTANEKAIFEELADQRRFEFLAGRFSAKESFSKAYGTGIGRFVSFQDLEILIDPQNGKPRIEKYPLASRLRAFISISHTDSLVMTEVILEKKL